MNRVSSSTEHRKKGTSSTSDYRVPLYRWIREVKHLKSPLVLMALIIASIPEGVFATAPVHLLKATNKPRFAGGNPAERNQFPWIISIQYEHEGSWKHDCGGAIIDKKNIVTAGHCVWNRKINEIIVVAGAHNIQKEESSQQRRRLERIYTHPNYTSGDGPGAYDIAVIRVQKAFKFNKYVKNLDAAKCAEEPRKGQECVYAGWGNTLPVSPLYYKGSDVLITESVTIISMKECQKVYSMYKDALKTTICSKSEVFHGTCQGDSGGPLTCYNKPKKKNAAPIPYLAGVVSFGFPVCNDGYHPDVFTSIGNPLVCNYLKEYEKIARDSPKSKKTKN